MGNVYTKRSKSLNSAKRRNLSIRTTNSNILVTRTNPIEQDYVISKGIGEGMNGKVFLCQNKLNNNKYALKVHNTKIQTFSQSTLSVLLLFICIKEVTRR